jgi:hypothetical protein
VIAEIGALFAGAVVGTAIGALIAESLKVAWSKIHPKRLAVVISPDGAGAIAMINDMIAKGEIP